MANPWLDFVKEFRKKLPKDTPYKDVLKKAKVEYAKTKKGDKPKAGTKGAKSKTHKGDKDFTTKKGDKDFHEKKKGKKEEKKSRKPFSDLSLVQESARQLATDAAAKRGRAKQALKDKFVELGGTPDELKKEVIKQKAGQVLGTSDVDLDQYLGGSLLGGDPATFSPEGGSLTASKDQRAKLVRQYGQAKKLVEQFLRDGQLNQKEFNNFRALSRMLSKSKSDKYAKDFKKISKTFNSKKYEKVMAAKMGDKKASDSKKLESKLRMVKNVLETIQKARPLFSETAFKTGQKVDASAPLDITVKKERSDVKGRKSAVMKGKTAHKRSVITLNQQGDLRDRPREAIENFVSIFGLDSKSVEEMDEYFEDNKDTLLQLQRELTYLGRIPEDLLNSNSTIADRIANQIVQVQEDLVNYANTYGEDRTGLRPARDGASVQGSTRGDAGTPRTRRGLVSLSKMDEHGNQVLQHLNFGDDDSIDLGDVSAAASTVSSQDWLRQYAPDLFDDLGDESSFLNQAKGDKSIVGVRGIDAGLFKSTNPSQFGKVNPELKSYINYLQNSGATVDDVAEFLLETYQTTDNGWVDKNTSKFHSLTYADYGYLDTLLKQPIYLDALNSTTGGTLPSDETTRLASQAASLQAAVSQQQALDLADQATQGVVGAVPATTQLQSEGKYIASVRELLSIISATNGDKTLFTQVKQRGSTQEKGNLNRLIVDLVTGRNPLDSKGLVRLGNALNKFGYGTPTVIDSLIQNLQSYPADLPKPHINTPQTVQTLRDLGVANRKAKLPVFAEPDPYSAPPSAAPNLSLDIQPIDEYTQQQEKDLVAYQAADDNQQLGAKAQLRGLYVGNQKVLDEMNSIDEGAKFTPTSSSPFPATPQTSQSTTVAPPEPVSPPPASAAAVQPAAGDPAPVHPLVQSYIDKYETDKNDTTAAVGQPHVAGTQNLPAGTVHKADLEDKFNNIMDIQTEINDKSVGQALGEVLGLLKKRISSGSLATVKDQVKKFYDEFKHQTSVKGRYGSVNIYNTLRSVADASNQNVITGGHYLYQMFGSGIVIPKIAGKKARPKLEGQFVAEDKEFDFIEIASDYGKGRKNEAQTVKKFKQLLGSDYGKADDLITRILADPEYADSIDLESDVPSGRGRDAVPFVYKYKEKMGSGDSPKDIQAQQELMKSFKILFRATGLNIDQIDFHTLVKDVLQKAYPNPKDYPTGNNDPVDINILESNKKVAALPEQFGGLKAYGVGSLEYIKTNLLVDLDNHDENNSQNQVYLKQRLEVLKHEIQKLYPEFLGQPAEGDISGGGFMSSVTNLASKAKKMWDTHKDKVKSLVDNVGKADEYAHTLASGLQKVRQVYGSNVSEVSSVSANDKVFADMANAVYNTNRPSYGEIKYVPNVSNETMAVYIDEQSKNIYIAFRGTSNLQDASTDVSLAVGNLAQTQRFQTDLQNVRKIRAEFSNYQFNYTGHSLGGTIAVLMLKMVGGNRAVVFNAGYGVNMGNVKGLNITSYQTQGDVVSALGTGRYKQNFVITNPHSQSNSALTQHKMSNFETGGDLTSGLNKAFQPIFLGGDLMPLGADPATYTPVSGAIESGATGKSFEGYTINANPSTETQGLGAGLAGGSGLDYHSFKESLRQIDNEIEALQETNNLSKFQDIKNQIKRNLHSANNKLQLGSRDDHRKFGKILKDLAGDYNKVVRGLEHRLGKTIQTSDNRSVVSGGGMGSFWQSPAGANALSINLTGRDLTGAKVGGALSDAIMNKIHPQVVAKIQANVPLTFQEHEHIHRMTGTYYQPPKSGGGFGSMDDNISGYKQMISQQSGNPLDYLPT